MRTQTLKITGSSKYDRAAIETAASIIRSGGIVAFPTETVYGLGADAFNASAVQKIFDAKERPAWDPLIVHVHSVEMLNQVIANEPYHLVQLAERFMPGALTVVVEKSERVPDIVTAGRQTVAVRMPAHPVALDLIQTSETPIAAPSANRFGRPSPTNAEHVLQDLDGRIDAVLDAGSTFIGVESTVLDLTTEPPTLLRPGGITIEQLQEIIGAIQITNFGLQGSKESGSSSALPSPGLSPRHYAPRALLVPIDPTPDHLRNAIDSWLITGKRVGVMLPDNWITVDSSRVNTYHWGVWGDWQNLAKRLFSGFRWLDAERVEVILVPLPPEEELARAIRDRILRASQPESRYN